MSQSCKRCFILFRAHSAEKRFPLILFTNKYFLCGIIDKYPRRSSVKDSSIGTYRCLSFLACLTNKTPEFRLMSLVSNSSASFLRKPHPYSIRSKMQNRTALSGLLSLYGRSSAEDIIAKNIRCVSMGATRIFRLKCSNTYRTQIF